MFDLHDFQELVYTENGMHSDQWFPGPLLKLFSDTLKCYK